MLTCSENDYLEFATMRRGQSKTSGPQSAIELWAGTYKGWYLDGGMVTAHTTLATSLVTQKDAAVKGAARVGWGGGDKGHKRSQRLVHGWTRQG